MAGKNGEERQFTVLLEQVRSEVHLVAEGLIALDRTVDRGFHELRQEMGTGFSDLRTALTEFAHQLKTHEHTHVN